MPLTATWVGSESIERIVDLRLRCYGGGPAERKTFLKKSEMSRTDPGDVLILSDDTGDVATATSHSMTINVRGTELPCQGVAWVGTVRSHRRRRIDGRGLASRTMDALHEKARERNQPVGMLAPFRVSFYEAFGYGVVERQHTWTVPLSLLPDDDTSGFAEYRDSDFDAALASRERQFHATHGDTSTSAGALKYWLATLNDVGFRLVDRRPDGSIASQFTLGTEMEDGRRVAVVNKPFYDSPEALRRMLAMLGTLKDQYSLARFTLPIDVPLNWMLRERQVPHRLVDHPASSCMAITRMQARIADVPAFVAALRPTQGLAEVAFIGIGQVTYRIDIADGRATARPHDGPADVTMTEPVAAAALFGDLDVAAAHQFGILRIANARGHFVLALLTGGPKPYCHEYF